MLTPSQSPGPTRALAEIRVDPRIPHQGLLVGIASTLLPFDGEGLFTKQDIFFPRYDARGRTKKWPIPDLVICEYLGRKVRHSQVISSSYKSAYVCALNNGWDIDAEEYTSCYGRFVNDNFAENTINCRLCPYTIPGTNDTRLFIVALPGIQIVAGEELYASYGGDYWLDC